MNQTPWWATKPPKKDHLNTSKSRLGETLSVPQRLVAVFLSTIATISVAAMVLISLVGIEGTYSSRGGQESETHIPNVDAVLNGCGSIFVFSPSVENYGVFDPNEVSPQESGNIRIPTAPMLIPAYGYMTENGLDTNYVEWDSDILPALPTTLRSMYDGKIIIWYDAKVGDGELSAIRSWAEDKEDVVVLPWRHETLGVPSKMTKYDVPLGRHIAFSAWNVTQSCMTFDAEAMNGFYDFAKEHAAKERRSKTPPEAQLNREDKLSPISVAG